MSIVAADWQVLEHQPMSSNKTDSIVTHIFIILLISDQLDLQIKDQVGKVLLSINFT